MPPMQNNALELDVLIIGAGLSGVDAAWHLQRQLPHLRYAILESRAELGGTWSLFRYPGIRSDSDMYTLGFPFRPWRGERSLADGATILQYMKDTAKDTGIDQHIRLHHRAVAASWDSAIARWKVTVEVGPERAVQELSCRFLHLCTGYYDYEQGHAPSFPGEETFSGQRIHPQFWPEGFDYTGKRVVVVGSGATAVTLVPAMVPLAEHVTMLQRSPTWIASLPSKDPLANFLRKWLPAGLAHSLVRAKQVAYSLVTYQIARRWPNVIRKALRQGQRAFLGREYDIDKHLTPRYQPWDERLCLVPDGDLFRAIRSGKAEIVTDQIEAFTAGGIRLQSGRELPADVIVTATGLRLLPGGGLKVQVDGVPVDLGATYAYQGIMLGNLPNISFCVGYINASWTLRADLVSRWICRVLRLMERKGYTMVRPRCDASTLQPHPLLEFRAGYVQRSVDIFPKQGAGLPWRFKQNFLFDLAMLRWRPLRDGTLEFTKGSR